MRKIIFYLSAVLMLASMLIPAGTALAIGIPVDNFDGWYCVNDGPESLPSNFYVSTNPLTKTTGSAIFEDGKIKLEVHPEGTYADAGIALYIDGSLTVGALDTIDVTGTGDDYAANLWFDVSGDGEFFAFDGDGRLTDLSGDKYNMIAASSGGTLHVDEASTISLDSVSYTLAEIKAGNCAGITSNTKVAVWIGNYSDDADMTTYITDISVSDPPNTIDSSTMVFQGTLELAGNGYIGTLAMVNGAGELAAGYGDGQDGFDVYARSGSVAMYDKAGSGSEDYEYGPVKAHDAYNTGGGWGTFYDPDCEDYEHYFLSLEQTGWWIEYATDQPYAAPMNGQMDWTNMYAAETGAGSYYSGVGTPEHDGYACNNPYTGVHDGSQAWDMDWSWGSEYIPLALPGFSVIVDYVEGGTSTVVLIPADDQVTGAGPVVNTSTGASYGTIQAAIDDASSGDTISVYSGEFAGAVVNKAVEVIGKSDGTSIITSGVPYKPNNTNHYSAFRPEVDGVTIRNFTIDCDEDLDLGVYGMGVDDVIVDSLTINSEGTVQGISNWGGSGWSITNNTITSTVASGGGGIGIFLGAKPLSDYSPALPVCANNLVQYNEVNATATANGYSCAGICVCLDLRYGGWDNKTGAEDVSGNQILNNEISSTGPHNSVAIEVGTILGDGETDPLRTDPDAIAAVMAAAAVHDNTVQGNDSDGAEVGVYLYNSTDLTISENTIENSVAEAIYAENGESGTAITNNTFDGNGVQVADNTSATTLDITSILSNNTFDRAVTVDHPGDSLLPVIWSNIQDATDATENDDTVNVAAGTYTETVVPPYHSLKFIGDGANVVTWDGGGEHCIDWLGPGVDVTIDTPLRYEISGFTFYSDMPVFNDAMIKFCKANRYQDTGFGLDFHDNILITPGESDYGLWLCRNSGILRDSETGESPVKVHDNIFKTTSGICMSNSDNYDIYNNDFTWNTVGNGDAPKKNAAIFIGSGCTAEQPSRGGHHIWNNTFAHVGDGYDGTEDTYPRGAISIEHYSGQTGLTLLANTIEENTFNNPHGCAVSYACGDDVVYPTDVIKMNDFIGNLYGVRVYGDFAANIDVNAVDNWWGKKSGPKNTTTNPTGLGDKVSDYVSYTPWLMVTKDNVGDETEVPEDDFGQKSQEFSGTDTTVDTTGTEMGNGDITVKTGLYSIPSDAGAPLPSTENGKRALKYVDVKLTNSTYSGNVRITISYTDEELASMAVDEDDLALYYWDMPDGPWTLALNQNLDKVNNKVSGDIPAEDLTGTPLCLGGTAEGTGEYQIGAAPSVDTVSFTTDNMTPTEEQTVTVEVSVPEGEDRTLEELTDVSFKVWHDSDGGIPLKAEFTAAAANTQTCAVITWNGTDFTLNSGGGDTTWELGTCTAPTLTGTTGTFTLKFTPGKVATATTGSDVWQLAAAATSEYGTSENLTYDDGAAEMEWYGELIIGQGEGITIDWGSVPAGMDFGNSKAIQPLGATLTFISNGSYAMVAKSSATWVGTEYTATLDPDGDCAGSLDFSLKTNNSGDHNTATILNTDGIVFNSGTITPEAGAVIADINLWLKLGAAFPVDIYSGVITYSIQPY